MIYKKVAFLSFVLISVFLIDSKNIFACECGLKFTVLYSFEESELVVITRAVLVKKVSENELNNRYAAYGVESTKPESFSMI